MVMFTFSQWFKFWQINCHFGWYLDLITTATNDEKSTAVNRLGWKPKLLYFHQFSYFVHCLLLYHLSIRLDEYSRLLLGDVALLFFAPEQVNLLHAFCCLQSVHLFYSLFWSDFEANHGAKMFPFKLINDVLFKDKGEKYFLEAMVTVRKDPSVKVKTAKVIRRRLWYCQGIIQYLYASEDLLYLLLKFSTCYFLYFHYWSRLKAAYFAPLPLLLIGMFRNVLFFNTFGILSSLILQILYSFSLIIFAQLRAVNGLLLKSKLNSPEKFNQFARFHTEVLLAVLKGNSVFSTQLLVFYVLLVPANTYLLIGLFLRQYTFVTGIIYGNAIIFIYLVILLFHLLASTYGKKLHRCSKALLVAAASIAAERALRKESLLSQGKAREGRKMSRRKSSLNLANNQSNSFFPLRDQLRLSSYVAKFHVPKKGMYGFTYGKFGGLITSYSFLKFVFIYIETLLYWYKLLYMFQMQ